MLDIKQIESFYPENIRHFKRNILREYLQIKILEIIFDSKFGSKLSFMGGTALRIIYQNSRFSEDIDFDNLGLTQNEFEQMTILVAKKLNLEGYNTETKNIFKSSYRCYLKVSDILFGFGLSGHRQEKILIQLDTEPQKFNYVSDKIIINKFNVFLRINVVPIDILLSQKIYAIFNRKRSMGRDFYDLVFLLGKTRPNFAYLNDKLKINSIADLKKKLLLKCKNLNFKQLVKDVEPFLFTPEESKKILYFQDYIRDSKI